MRQRKRFRILTTGLLAGLFAVSPLTASAATASVANQKASLAQYAKEPYKLTCSETLLCGFESAKEISGSGVLCTADHTQGNACGELSLKSDATLREAFRLTKAFSVNASEKNKVTFALDVWVNDMALLVCDHEAGYPQNDYSHSGTLYWRLTDAAGRTHCINTTILDKNGAAGWQTIEFTLLHDNGVSGGFDYSRITGSWLMLSGRAGLKFRFDNLRVRNYRNTGYTADLAHFPDGCRIISTCDADALDGAVVSEWFGNSFSDSVRAQGSSSLKYTCSPEDDYRIFFGGLGKTVSYADDYLCFWVRTEQGIKITQWFLEINQVQDKIEYQNPSSSAVNIMKYAVGGFRHGEWNLIQLPIRALQKNGAGDTLQAEHLRMVISTKEEEKAAWFDCVYLCNAAQAAVAKADFEHYRAAGKTSGVASSKTEIPEPVISSSLTPASGVSSQNTGNEAPLQTDDPAESSDTPAKTAGGESGITDSSSPAKNTLGTGGILALVAAGLVAAGVAVMIALDVRKRKKSALPDSPDK